MNVNFDGRTYSFEVKPGPDGYRQFTEAIRRAFSLPEDSELNITFTCDEPSTGWEAVEPPSPGEPSPTYRINPIFCSQVFGKSDSHDCIEITCHALMHGVTLQSFAWQPLYRQ
jgi:hypothetical protein